MGIRFGLKLLLLFVVVRGCPMNACAQDNILKSKLEHYIQSCRAEIGVAVIMDAHDTICVNNASPYPMNSVLKLYQALAVADVLQKRGVALDSCILIEREELYSGTYSPLRDKYLSGKVSLSIAELLKYSLQQSDNIACDILFDRIVGLEETDKYIRTLGVEDFAIRANERDMFENHEASSKNWNYPLAAATLIYKLFTEPLYKPIYQKFLIETLVGCQTGKERLAEPFLQTNAVIGHKTGTGFTSLNGLPQGINDVGFVRLPTGRYYAIAVFIKSSQKNMVETEQMIADISEIVYQHIIL